MGIALDSARLFEDAQMRAKRERIVGDITSHIRTTLDIHTILLTAAREIRNELGLAEAEVRLREVVQPICCHRSTDRSRTTPCPA